MNAPRGPLLNLPDWLRTRHVEQPVCETSISANKQFSTEPHQKQSDQGAWWYIGRQRDEERMEAVDRELGGCESGSGETAAGASVVAS